MLWVYGHYKYCKSFSAGIHSRCQNLWRMASFHTPRGCTTIFFYMKLLTLFLFVCDHALHLHPLQVDNRSSNSRLVVNEDNGKFRLERNKTYRSFFLARLIRVYYGHLPYPFQHGSPRHHQLAALTCRLVNTIPPIPKIRWINWTRFTGSSRHV